MMMPSVRTQIALFSTAAAGLSLYGASQPGMSDRTRLVTAGMAGIFGAASAMSGFKVWAAINAGAAIGTLATIPMMRMKNGSDDAKAGADQVNAAASGVNFNSDAPPPYSDWIKTQYQQPGDQLLQSLQNHEANNTLSLRQRIHRTPLIHDPQAPATR